MASGDPAAAEVRAFRIEVPEDELDDLRYRLAHTRWASEPAGDLSEYGVPRRWVEDLVQYWQDSYDWRAWEARLNAYPQYTTTIDGANIHFLHIRSPQPNALPLILTHGWPGSVVEFLDVIAPLTDPTEGPAFDLVIPSLPGFTWSGPTPDTGWGPQRIARAWATLMERLGYHRYGAVGNDWGSHIAPELGRIAPDCVVGVHVTQLFSFPDGEWLAYPPSTEPDHDALTPDDRQALNALRDLQHSHGAYAHVHAQRPHTLGFGLTDSPVALLAWNGQMMRDLDPDTLLTHITAYWLTRTATSAMRIYAEHQRQTRPTTPTTAPLALSQFRDDLQSIRAYANRDHANITSWTIHCEGGHYAAHQAPALLAQDLRTFYESVSAR
ncbi:epoxide hydrolase family protein [Kribbella sp. NPDC026611]|uniref:epoxide hydrolase family protein n=1 Tax=Kribbella sp. NPDC026611 TaxID=3154911 RepID=UPI0033D14130